MITYIISSIVLLDFWVNEVEDLKNPKNKYAKKLVKRLRGLKNKLNYKPFSCSYCLSFWLSFIGAMLFFSPYPFLILIFNKIS